MWNPQSQNQYSYVHNNPMVYVDPSGHIAWHQWDNLAKGIYDSLEESVKDLLNFRAFIDFGKAIYNKEITPKDIVLALGDGAKYKLEYFAENTKPVLVGDPTDKEVRRFGKELGDVLSMVVGSSAGLKIISKVSVKLAKKLDIKGLLDCNCFTAGTKVQTDEGEKAIEDIEVGDKVLAKDEETGEVAYKEVGKLFQREVDETYNLTVGNEVITTTNEHPFWIIGKGWIEAENLQVGDVLTTSDGKEVAIEKIKIKKEHVTVYNFMVKDFHTYFVSNLGIWTHNACKIKGTTKAIDNVPSSLLKGPSNTHVYFGVKNGKIDYVGISKNPSSRFNQHGERFDVLRTITNEPLTRRQARAIEQALINRNPNFSNKINSISPKRDWYDEAVKWGEAWLKEKGY